MSQSNHWDVVIIGAGLAGLTLARQLLISSDKRVLHLERQETVPRKRQKVGESTVQIAGFYYSKVLDLEEYLHQAQLMKYNLRFFWPSAGDPNQYESYSQGYIRWFSNIPSYQLDRNRFERDLIGINLQSMRYRLETGVTDIEPQLDGPGAHRIRYRHQGHGCDVTAQWVVDSSGRNRILAKRMELRRDCHIPNSSAFFWVDGLVNVEKLTDTPHLERIRHPSRKAIGHAPVWLGTNHLMGEGFWFWIIPIKYLTSFGLVFTKDRVDTEQVNSKEKLLAWLFERFPLLRRELEGREIIDFTFMRNYSYDCERTIHPDRWAMSGEAGRFSDPLYSPGSDLIALHNSLICDAILTESQDELAAKLALYEPMMKTLFHSFLPSYTESYPPLGDQECLSLKYTWELSVYFGFLVFPFINGLFTDTSFLPGFFRRFTALGEVNNTIQRYIRDFYEWKKTRFSPPGQPIYFDFTSFETLKRAERTFYLSGSTAPQAHDELDRQLANLREFATWIIAHIDSVVLDEPELVMRADYIAAIDAKNRAFDPDAMRAQAGTTLSEAMSEWTFDPMMFRETFHAKA